MTEHYIFGYEKLQYLVKNDSNIVTKLTKIKWRKNVSKFNKDNTKTAYTIRCATINCKGKHEMQYYGVHTNKWDYLAPFRSQL